MPVYTPPLRDMQFVMHEVLKVGDLSHEARRFRTILWSFEKNIELLFKGTGLAAEVDHAALAEALAEEAPADAPAAEETADTGAADQNLPVGPPMTAGEKDALRVAVNACWNVGALSMEALRTTITAHLSPHFTAAWARDRMRNRILDAIQGAQIKLVFLDACRNNPFPPDAMLKATPDAAPVPVSASGLSLGSRGAALLADFSDAPGERGQSGQGLQAPAGCRCSAAPR